MSFLIRLLLPLIGYVCVATVISAGFGYGYLRKSGRLDDETLFRITALVQGVDLEEIEKAKQAKAPDAPAEEPSFEEQQQQSQAATIHFDAKRKQLADLLAGFDDQLQRLNDETNKYTTLRESVEKYLEELRTQIENEHIAKVREQLEGLNPKTQAKELLVKMIDADRTDEVIMLLGSMKKRNRENILLMFVTDKEIEMLYRIQREMLAGGKALPYIDERLNELEQLKEQVK